MRLCGEATDAGLSEGTRACRRGRGRVGRDCAHSDWPADGLVPEPAGRSVAPATVAAPRIAFQVACRERRMVRKALADSFYNYRLRAAGEGDDHGGASLGQFAHRSGPRVVAWPHWCMRTLVKSCMASQQPLDYAPAPRRADGPNSRMIVSKRPR